MKTIITVGRRRDNGKLEIFLDERATLNERRRIIKPIRIARKHPVYSEIYDFAAFRRFKLEKGNAPNPKAEKPKPNMVQRAVKRLTPKKRVSRKPQTPFAQRMANL